ncbi:AlpA family transcriptional regulator [uncultured Cohaesibacter sp.]|uniref:helix-turn-helix transcriptional regulator n=1 Tax=uncultured Cohaesibacter sp. TaxID=1002546 RepID=UPI002931397D|nr:AlpA family transcriptional regulator [uncultured Cohaesibacter sp.]
MSERLIALPEVLNRTSLSRSSLYERMKESQFPKPISLGGRRVAWLETEVVAWIDERINARPSDEVRA